MGPGLSCTPTERRRPKRPDRCLNAAPDLARTAMVEKQFATRVPRMERLRGRSRSLFRQALWRVWPSSPSSWSEVPTRLRPAGVEIGRLTAAAVISYLMTLLVTPASTDLTAPLTALLVVQLIRNAPDH